MQYGNPGHSRVANVWVDLDLQTSSKQFGIIWQWPSLQNSSVLAKSAAGTGSFLGDFEVVRKAASAWCNKSEQLKNLQNGGPCWPSILDSVSSACSLQIVEVMFPNQETRPGSRWQRRKCPWGQAFPSWAASWGSATQLHLAWAQFWK